MVNRWDLSWQPDSIKPRVYVCRYCGDKVRVGEGFTTRAGSSSVHICPCGGPTAFDMDDHQWPAPLHGAGVDGIESPEVAKLYEEARACMSVDAYTCAVMACRKILMNVAVSKKAPEGLHFIEYVDFLEKGHYFPPDALDGVKQIKDQGNEANHKVRTVESEEAKAVLYLAETLLRFVFELPSRLFQP